MTRTDSLPATCEAVVYLVDRIAPSAFYYAFAAHLALCGPCRAVIGERELQRIASCFLAELGEEEAPLPEPTVLCEQVEFLSYGAGPVELDLFRQSYAEHIVGCPRCLRHVPGRIAPELLVPVWTTA